MKARVLCIERACGSTTGKFRAAVRGALALSCCGYCASFASNAGISFVLSGVVLGYLVDPASSHMLVSKIKPCMSKYKFYTAKL